MGSCTYIYCGDSFEFSVLIDKSGPLHTEDLFNSGPWELDCRVRGRIRSTTVVVSTFELTRLLKSAVRATLGLVIRALSGGSSAIGRLLGAGGGVIRC